MSKNKSRVLIVDDNRESRKLLASIISKCTEHEVLLANSGEVVLNVIEKYQPDAVLLDIMMPGIDGYEITRILKSNPKTKEIPIIFITALSGIEDKVKGFEIGGVDYILKPFNTNDLLARLNTHIQLKGAKDELKKKNELLIDREAHLVHLIEEKTTELKEQLYTDSLTKLPNRMKLKEDIEGALYPTLILINIDNFREINSFFGNKIGDFIIFELGNRLKTVINGAVGKLYKLHADEYAVLIPEKIEMNSFKQLLNFLHDAGEETPYVYYWQKIRVDVTLGVSNDKNDIFEKADMALKYAKRKRMIYFSYDESMRIKKEYESNLQWARIIREAIEEERIISYFQPIINNKNKSIEKYEALVRLIDESGNIISPSSFLDVAKKSRQYALITKAVVQTSFSRFQDSQFELSINLSVEDILNKDTVELLKSSIKEYHLGGRLVFEILESEGIESYDEVLHFINQMKSLGCKIAIDDFGSGYSNFEYILRLAVNYIKIDASLIKNVDKDKDAQIIVATIVGFSKKLGIQTIAESVHSKKVYEKVGALGVDYSQGYHLGEPNADISVSSTLTA